MGRGVASVVYRTMVFTPSSSLNLAVENADAKPTHVRRVDTVVLHVIRRCFLFVLLKSCTNLVLVWGVRPKD
jgi:hypothetical protein